MSNESLIKLFLENNILLTPEEFKKLEGRDYREFLESKIKSNTNISHVAGIKKEKAKSVTEKDGIKFQSPLKEEKTEVRFLGEPVKPVKRKIKTVDVISIYNRKYNELREILSSKTEPISVNKIGETKDKITIIGIVSQKTENGFTIEDETGAMNVISSRTEDIENDDVIAVRGRVKNNSFFSEDVIFPDVPLENKQKIIDTEISFDFSSSGNLEINGKRLKINIAAFFSVKKGKDEMKILFYRSQKKMEQSEPVNIIRKRCIKIEDGVLPEFFVIKEIPDVFIISSPGSEKTRMNYKSVTIIKTAEKDRIELKQENS